MLQDVVERAVDVVRESRRSARIARWRRRGSEPAGVAASASAWDIEAAAPSVGAVPARRSANGRGDVELQRAPLRAAPAECPELRQPRSARNAKEAAAERANRVGSWRLLATPAGGPPPGIAAPHCTQKRALVSMRAPQRVHCGKSTRGLGHQNAITPRATLAAVRRASLGIASLTPCHMGPNRANRRTEAFPRLPSELAVVQAAQVARARGRAAG